MTNPSSIATTSPTSTQSMSHINWVLLFWLSVILRTKWILSSFFFLSLALLLLPAYNKHLSHALVAHTNSSNPNSLSFTHSHTHFLSILCHSLFHLLIITHTLRIYIYQFFVLFSSIIIDSIIQRKKSNHKFLVWSMLKPILTSISLSMPFAIR